MKFIIDASCIIAFYSKNELNNPNLLNKLSEKGYELIIPQKVYDEIKKGNKPTIKMLEQAIKNGIIQVDQDSSTEEIIKYKNRYPRLDDGEIQVLLLGYVCKNNNEKYRCVIDEGPGRKVANELSLCLTGTKGIIVLLEQLKIITPTTQETLFKSLRESNFRT